MKKKEKGNKKKESLTNTNLENNGSNKDGHYTGGIVGYITIDAYKENAQTIVSCISNSTIKGHYVGGIVGRTYGNITRSTSNSICTGWKVGGIAGFQANKSSITNCLINGKLIQNNELRNSYKIAKSNTVEDSGISNNAQIAGISALAIGLSNYNDVPHMENCFVNCEMEGDNQFKDSAVNKHVSGSKLIGFIDNDSYKNCTWTGTIKNCVFNTHLAPNAKNRFEFSDDSFLGLGGLVFSLTYSYSIIDFNGTNWNAFDSFDKSNIWNIDSINNIVTIK